MIFLISKSSGSVKLNGKVVYTLTNDPTGAVKHDYKDEGLTVQDGVEEHIKQWLQQRGGEDSD